MDIQEAMRRLEQARLDKVGAMNRIVLTVERNSTKRTPVRKKNPPPGGTLRRSHAHRVESSGERGVVGTNIKYSRYVHDGTRYMAARPYYEWGMQDSDADIKTIIDDLGTGYLEEIVK